MVKYKRATKIMQFTILLTLLISLVNIVIADAESLDEWPMYQHDTRNTGYTTSRVRNANFSWFYPIPTGGYYQNIAAADGKVYVSVMYGPDSSILFCVDAFSGDHYWSYEFDKYNQESSPAIYDGRVYIGCGDGLLYCLNASDGNLIWSYQTSNTIYTSPVIENDRVYFSSWTDGMYCLTAQTGETVWKFDVWNLASSPAIVSGRIYFGGVLNDSARSSVYCLDAGNGEYVWSTYVGEPHFMSSYSSPAIENGFLYIGVHDDGLYCLNIQDGSIKWNTYLGDHNYTSPVLGNGKVFIASEDGKLYCLDQETGSISWSYETDRTIISSPVVTADSIYVTPDYGDIYCIDPDSGQLLWRYPTQYAWTSSPVIAYNRLYIGANNGILCLGSHVYLELISDFGVALGEGWYDENTVASFTISPTLFSNTSSVRHVFTGWSSDSLGGYSGSESSVDVVMNDEIIETAHWQTQYYLTVEDGVGGSVTSSSGWFDAGSEVTISATPNSGFTFSSWISSDLGSYSGANSNYTITLNGPITERPVFLDIADPIADAGLDRTSIAGELIAFNAMNSMDNVGIVSYEWDFGDGTTEAFLGATHVYNEPGTYTVTLTVKDKVGNDAKDTVLITVEDMKEPFLKKWGFPIWILYAIGFAILMVIIFILMVKYS